MSPVLAGEPPARATGTGVLRVADYTNLFVGPRGGVTVLSCPAPGGPGGPPRTGTGERTGSGGGATLATGRKLIENENQCQYGGDVFFAQGAAAFRRRPGGLGLAFCALVARFVRGLTGGCSLGAGLVAAPAATGVSKNPVPRGGVFARGRLASGGAVLARGWAALRPGRGAREMEKATLVRRAALIPGARCLPGDGRPCVRGVGRGKWRRRRWGGGRPCFRGRGLVSGQCLAQLAACLAPGAHGVCPGARDAGVGSPWVGGLSSGGGVACPRADGLIPGARGLAGPCPGSFRGAALAPARGLALAGRRGRGGAFAPGARGVRYLQEGTIPHQWICSRRARGEIILFPLRRTLGHLLPARTG